MARTLIDPKDLYVRINFLWGKQWMLLTCGDYAKQHFNTMTVGWGSIGVMWNKAFVQVVVRPTRYTYEFMESYDTFTLCAFSPKYKDSLEILGTRSGKDGDKIAQACLTPAAAQSVAAPCFEEAELVLECVKLYWDDFNPAHFFDWGVDSNYPNKDYHRIYFGEIREIYGEDSYRV